MSRTTRCQSGDLRFTNPNRRNYNNKFWGFSPLKWTTVKIPVEVPCWWSKPSHPWEKQRTYIDYKYKRVCTGLREHPADDDVLFNQKFVNNQQRDGWSRHTTWVKHYSKKLRRSTNRHELARLKKIADYEDMHYEEHCVTEGLWWYYD